MGKVGRLIPILLEQLGMTLTTAGLCRTLSNNMAKTFANVRNRQKRVVTLAFATGSTKEKISSLQLHDANAWVIVRAILY